MGLKANTIKMLDDTLSVQIVLILQFVVVMDSFGTTLFPIILAEHSDQKTILANHSTHMPHSTCKENEYGPDCTFCVAFDTCRDGHYTCDNKTGSKICMDGWKGADCTEKDVSLDSYFNLTCPENQCRNNGECVSGTCCCQAGFTGVLCQIEIIECQSRPCQNGASCLDLVDGYECFCRSGFTGKNCETRLTHTTTTPNRCNQHSCQNGGTCYEDTFSTYCVCPLWFTGEVCEKDLRHRNLLQTTICPAHLYGKGCRIRCVPANSCDDGHYMCDPADGRQICLVGWKGDKCDIRRLPQHLDNTCPSDRNCKNGGQCFGGKCCCKNPFSGPVCNIESIGCHSNPCFNGGSCIDKDDNGTSDYTCVCRGNFEGNLCERHKATQAMITLGALNFTSDGVTDLPKTSTPNSKERTTQTKFNIDHTGNINHSIHVTQDALTNTNTEIYLSKTTEPHSNTKGSQHTSTINSMLITSDFKSNTPVSDPVTTSLVTSDGAVSGISISNSITSTPRTSLKILEHRQSTDAATSTTSKSVFPTSQKVEYFMRSHMPTLRPEMSSVEISPAYTDKPGVTSTVMPSINKGISDNQFALESSSTQSTMPEITIRISNRPAESLRTDTSTETKKQHGTSAVSSSVLKSTESLLLTSTNYINDSLNMHTSAFISNRPPAGSASLNTHTLRGTANIYASTVGPAQSSKTSTRSATQHYSNSVRLTSSEILLLTNKTVIPSELPSLPNWISRTPSYIHHSEPIAVTDFSKSDTTSRPSTHQMSSTPTSFGKDGTILSTIKTKPVAHLTPNSSTRNKKSTIRNTHGIQQTSGTSEKAFSATSSKVSSKAWTHILITSPIISFIESKRTMSPTLYLLSTSRPTFPSNNVTQMQILSNVTSFKNESTSSMGTISYLSTQSPTAAKAFSLAHTSLHESLKNASNETGTEALTPQPNSENQTWWIIVVGIVAGVVLLAAVSVLFAVIFKYIITRESRTLKQSPEEIVQFDKEHFSMEPNFDNPIFLDEPDFQDDTTKSDIYVINR